MGNSGEEISDVAATEIRQKDVHVQDLGWVDIDLRHSTICLVLLGQMGIWLNWLGSWAKGWNIQIKVNPTMCQTTSPTLYNRR